MPRRAHDEESEEIDERPTTAAVPAARQGGQTSQARIARLQQTVGNAAVARMLRGGDHERGCGCGVCGGGPTLAREPGDGATATASTTTTDTTTGGGGGGDDGKVASTHGAVAVQGGPATAADVRAKVMGGTPAAADIADFLADRVRELKGMGLSSSVKDQASLIPVLAADMKRKAAAKGEPDLGDAGWTAAAESQILGNKTTALTTSDDRYTEIEGGEKFDELHEFIHICSAQGGESPLMGFSSKLNEGAINYFSELTAPAAGVSPVTRYTEETPVAAALVRAIGTEGPEKLYNATFKGEVDAFFLAVGTAYVAGPKTPNGKNKGFSEKKWTAVQAAEEIQKNVKNWSMDFIKGRFI